VRQDVMRKGSEATSLLVRAIASRAPQRTDHRSLPTELIVRSSTARPSVRRTTHRSGT
jgi:DNA-binding LacI/PurR family transcriptional regulator